MSTKAVTNIITTSMALGLVSDNFDYLNKKKKKKSLVKLGVDNVVGTSLIQATSQAANY